MRKIACTMLALLVLLTACSGSAATDPTEYIHTPYVSTITSAECFVCGGSKDSPARRFWGQDNVGILNLNTFQVLPLEINRYEDGELIKEAAGFTQYDGIRCAESSANTCTNPDRGYGHVQIQGQRKSIDPAAIQSHLCQTCLDEINGMYFWECPPEEYAIVNFSDRTIRPLLRPITFFVSEHYAVNCLFQANGNIDLLIFYCPPRFE